MRGVEWVVDPGDGSGREGDWAIGEVAAEDCAVSVDLDRLKY